jgi:hypothetical protein
VQDVPAQAEFFQDAGTKVFDQDVCLSQQLFQDRLTVGVLEVEGQGLFVAGLDELPQ